MSIIYDALKKVEASAPQNKGETPGKNKYIARIKILPLYVLVIGFGFLAAHLFYKSVFLLFPAGTLKSEIPQKEPAAALSAAQSALKPQTQSSPELTQPIQSRLPEPAMLVLNGIFFSGQEGYALINNQIVKKGDLIEGMLVTRIGIDEVELKKGESTLRLSKPK